MVSSSSDGDRSDGKGRAVAAPQIDWKPALRAAALQWGPVLAVGVAVWAMGPPEGVAPRGWFTASVFAATIVSFVTRPLAMGPMVLIALVVLLVSGAFTPVEMEEGANPAKAAVEAMLAGYADATAWLVVSAFLLSGAVVRTDFGRRISLLLIRSLGGTTLGLGYAIAGTELILGPVIPSNTARGGGVMAPIVNALARALGSDADDRRAGSYLVLCGAHANLIAAAMFFTGMAANPQIRRFALTELDQQWTWTMWLQGSWLPGVVGMGLLPLLIYRLSPPGQADSSEARQQAVEQLRAMGGWTWRQIALGGLLAAMVVAWAMAGRLGIHVTSIALVGLVLILLLGIDRWEHFVGDRAAWDALIWLGGLIAMAEQLEALGVVQWFADVMKQQVAGFSPVATAVALALIYFFSMYAFSMLTGHLVAMAGVFFVVARAADCPPLLIVALIAYFSNLCGCLTNYSSGPIVIYFGLGYVEQRKWFLIGLAVGIFHLVVWLGIGLPYWKALGWW